MFNSIEVIRLKSDNYDCYVCPETYYHITLQMSSGDFGAHKHRSLEVNSSATMDNIRRFNKFGYIEYDKENQGYWFYDGKGDAQFETEL